MTNKNEVDLAIACSNNLEIQLNVNKPAVQVEQKTNIKIGIIGGNNFMKRFMKKLENCEMTIETCPQIESGIIERISNEEQGPVKKLVPNEN